MKKVLFLLLLLGFGFLYAGLALPSKLPAHVSAITYVSIPDIEPVYPSLGQPAIIDGMKLSIDSEGKYSFYTGRKLDTEEFLYEENDAYWIKNVGVIGEGVCLQWNNISALLCGDDKNMLFLTPLN